MAYLRKIPIVAVLAALVLILGVASVGFAAYLNVATGSYLDLDDLTVKNWTDVYQETQVNAQQAGFGFTVNAYTGNWTGIPGVTPGATFNVGSGSTITNDDWPSRAGTEGLGVDSIDPGATEINYDEMLEVTFHEPVYLNSISLSLFYQESGYIENGFYSVNGLGWVEFSATADINVNDSGSGGANWRGLYTITPDLGNLLVTSLRLVGGYGLTSGGDHQLEPGSDTIEFKLTGLDVAQPVEGTPEPGTLVLLGSAAGLAGLYRRRRNDR